MSKIRSDLKRLTDGKGADVFIRLHEQRSRKFERKVKS